MPLENRQAGATEIEITPEMAEAGARVLRERIEASYYWSRGVASEVFRAMMGSFVPRRRPNSVTRARYLMAV